MPTPLTTRIPIRDRSGNIIDEKEVATYAGLLARAHDEGLTSIATALVQAPSEENGQVAIVTATVETSKGHYAGIGDASPANVHARIAPHLIRMAETRAKARALRDAVNIGLVSLEELGSDEAGEILPLEDLRDRPRVAPRTLPSRRGERPARSGPATPSASAAPEPMSESQRRLLFRILAEHGYEGDEALQLLCETARVDDVRQITKPMASRLIDHWKNTEPTAHAS